MGLKIQNTLSPKGRNSHTGSASKNLRDGRHRRAELRRSALPSLTTQGGNGLVSMPEKPAPAIEGLIQ